MANNGPKFASVNLNKSYGQPHQSSSHNAHSQHYNGGGGSSYRQPAPFGRGRSFGGNAGGMVVLSRNRGAAASKVVPKLSVPSPLNLPSLRKEHEKYDILGPGGSGVGAGSSGGSRPTSSAVGWTKPVAVASATMTENSNGTGNSNVRVSNAIGDVNAIPGSYRPPSARSGMALVTSAAQDNALSAEKSMLLRGEDFPSLQAARPLSSGATQKHKNHSNQNKKQVENEELNLSQEESYRLGLKADAPGSELISVSTRGNQLIENSRGHMSSQISRNGKYIPDPLALFHMSPRSDWADDERDTGQRFVVQERDVGLPKGENYWERDFDFPRSSFTSHKLVQKPPGRHVQRDIINSLSTEVRKTDPYNKDISEVNLERREVHNKRTTLISRDGVGFQETGNSRVDVRGKIPQHQGVTSQEDGSTGSRESLFSRRDFGNVGRQHQNSSVESFKTRSSNPVHWNKHISEQKGDIVQDNVSSKPVHGSSGQFSDPVMTVSHNNRFLRRDRPFSQDKPPIRDISSALFDEDIHSVTGSGIFKRKKDAGKIIDFHDPVRESFEAEIERVQRMQELERKRVTEEQERAIEQAQREEAEKHKRNQEEEEQLRRQEEEAREAAWRAEQDRLEAIRQGEEHRIAREEEKKRIQLEEERRKQAAKKMLEDLEARMAKKQANAIKDDASAPNTGVYEKLEEAVKDKYTFRKLDLDSGENRKRVMDNAINSGSFSSNNNRPEISSKLYPAREDSPNFLERGRAIGSWRRDAFENDDVFPFPTSDLGADHHPRHDMHARSRAAPSKESYGPGYMPQREFLKAGMNASSPDNFGNREDHRWDLSRDMDSYGKPKLADPELHNDISGKYDDDGWIHGYSHHALSDRMYPPAEANELYFSGRPRYSLRQPHVLPPPSLASVQRTNSVNAERAGNGIRHAQDPRNEPGGQRVYFDHNQHLEPSETFRLEKDNITSEDHKLENQSRCGSQSSLYVLSPPASPPHLSHDESESSYVLSSSAEDDRNLLTRNNSVIDNSNNGNGATVMVSDSLNVGEDEEWTPKHDHAFQQQEEYDEDDRHLENDGLHDFDDENIENEENESTHGDGELPHFQNNLVSGFHDFVKVEIPVDDFENMQQTQGGLVGPPGTSFGFADERRPAIVFPSQEQSHPISDNSHKSESHPEKHALESSCQQTSIYSSSTISNDKNCVGTSGASLFTRKRVVQGDLPVKLQFGLFSETSIPSSMPAIQIGSIQMPLHLHVGPSQHPIFQFGQLNHTSSLSQGILPTSPQLTPCVQSSVDAGPVADSHHQISNVHLNSSSHLSQSGDNKFSGTGPHVEEIVQLESGLPSGRARGSGSHLRHPQPIMKPAAVEKNITGVARVQQVSGGRGRRFIHEARNMHTGSSMRDFDILAGANKFQRKPRWVVQRKEYRIREKSESKPTETSVSSNGIGLEDHLDNMDKSFGNLNTSNSKRRNISSRTMKQKADLLAWSSENMIPQKINSVDIAKKEMQNDFPTKIQNVPEIGAVNLKQNTYEEEEDVDAPLQSGVVRVFRQPGIEGPSDEDDFIAVRSKRQLLNIRREQREKELKAKTRIPKQPIKQNVSRQKDPVSKSPEKQHGHFSGNTAQIALPAASLPLTVKPHVNSESHSIIIPSSSSVPIVSNTGREQNHGKVLDSKNKVMPLSQNQFNGPMKPAQHNLNVSSGGLPSTENNAISEVPLPPPIAQDKAFSVASSISSLFAGEKIQFGAVTYPEALPSSTSVISHKIGAPGMSRREVKISTTFPLTQKNSTLFSGKDEHSSADCVPMQDSEAEAEAAASAVAVAAISNDEMVGNDIPSANDTKSFGGSNLVRRTGFVGDQQPSIQSRADEFIASLPADLSVETTPISLWPPLPSPQSSSGQMQSHFTSGTPSYFPFYDMNPLLGGPIFAPNPNEESSGAQSQPQKGGNTPASSGILGNWQHNVASYYGHPAGYPAPFVCPPGSIPGVHGSPMVVYNHLTPIGQYSQVGLSFMGSPAPYIPSAKQPDWKNSSTSSGTCNNETDTNNATLQRNAPSPIQHLAPRPLLPFRAASDLPVQQTCWGQVPSAPLQSAPIARPLRQPQLEATFHSIDQSSSTESRVPPPSDITIVAASSFPTDLAVESSNIESGKTNENIKLQSSDSIKPQQKNVPPQHAVTSGYNFQRRGGNEWARRRSGFHGRNQSSAGDGFPATAKVRQIYVAKQTSSHNE